jgi:hypothetical protein
MSNAERQRLDEADRGGIPWRRWGPYLSERQWGTVREDYGGGHDTWSSFTHEQARSRAYRWGEDGLAGISDDKQRLCLALALWNERDPILKERMFGLTNAEGNHGEDVKECYFYVDAMPTSSYLRMIYKYPQAEYPYGDLVAVNGARSKQEPEYELLDTGIFDDGRYFDVEVEYAKAAPEDIAMRVRVRNNGSDDAMLHVLPTLWFRHTWSWAGGAERPELRVVRTGDGGSVVRADHAELGTRWLCADAAVPVLVTGNETNNERVFGSPNESPYVKDGIDRAVVQGDASAVNPDGVGTKAALHYVLKVPAGGTVDLRVRLSDTDPASGAAPFDDFDQVMDARRDEAAEFWAAGLAGDLTDDERLVCRQALAGMLWSKQYYALDMERWLAEHGADPLAGNSGLRNEDWRHLIAEDVISMPDKWEYPWFAAWDLAFHTVALAAVDVGFAKQQLDLLLNRRYLHPNGQLPAYEWNFGDVNPPVHAWAIWFVYELEKGMTGRGDRDFLEKCFVKLKRNFDWWLNRKDLDNRSIFQGGFLGLDNIGVFDRSAPLPGGGHIDQADGTAWMALFCQNMAQIATELARENPVYLEQAKSLTENFAWIAAATNQVGTNGAIGLWDEGDGFFYDVLRRPDGSSVPLKVRSIVGLMPLAAATVIPGRIRTDFPELIDDTAEFLSRHPSLIAALPGRGSQVEATGPVLLALFDESRLRRILAKMLDEEEFLGPHGIRAVSRYHAYHPYTLTVDGQEYRVGYLPAESDTGMFGGNSNWRGPVWFPINIMLVRALMHLHGYFGEDFTVECPTGSGKMCTLHEVAQEISERLTSTFLRDSDGRRPVHGGQPILQNDPHWRDLVLFYEYIHGDNGAGIGASHQTGWTGTVALLPLLFRGANARALLAARFDAGEATGLPRQRKPEAEEAATVGSEVTS